jgi:hypothetical protein
LLQFTPPGVETGLCDVVSSAESSNRETAVLPEWDQASPMLLFVRIARFAVGHDDALLSEDIAPLLSRTRSAGQTLNNDLKGQVNATGLPGDKGEVRSHVQGFMRQLLHLPEHVMNYFQYPSVQYAAALN